MRFQIIHLGNPYDFIVKDHKTDKTYGTFQGESTSLKECFEDITKEIEQLEIQIADLKYENKTLKSNLSSCRRERKTLQKENIELKSIKSFAERNGICIHNIDEAFRKCWNDNAELVTENKQLKEAIIGKIQYNEDLEKFAIKKGIISKDWARFDDYD